MPRRAATPRRPSTSGCCSSPSTATFSGGQHWFRQAARAGHHRAAVELASLLSAAGFSQEAERWLSDPPSPIWDRTAEPELVARAELAAAAVSRRGGAPLKVGDLTEILGTWDLVTRPLRDHTDVVAWLTEQSGLPPGAIEHLARSGPRCSVPAAPPGRAPPRSSTS